MTKEEKQEDMRIHILALHWWNCDDSIPIEDIAAVQRYINEHPELFKGAGPQ